MTDTLNLETAATLLGCSVKTVRRRIASGELRASHIARGRWVIRRHDLDAYLDAAATRPRSVSLPAPEAQPIQPHATVRRRRRSGQPAGRLVVTDGMGRA